MNTLLIGLAGPARCGKSTVAQMLEECGFDAISFAGPLKRGLAAMLGLGDEELEGALKEQPLGWLGRSPRELMQTLGTEWGRDLVARDLWLRVCARGIDESRRAARALGQPWHGVVVTDVRFENEAAWLRARGGWLMHVRRGDAPVVRAHVSEAGVALREGDLILHNGGTVEDLRAQLDGLLFAMVRGEAALSTPCGPDGGAWGA